jgi:ketosteroid isomerase-like protein
MEVDDRKKEAVMQALRRFLTAYEYLDFAGLTRCFVQDEEVSIIFPGSTRLVIYRGWPSVLAAWQAVFHDEKMKSENSSRIKLVPGDLSVQIFGDTAIATFLVNSSPPDIVHRRTIVFVRREDRWLIVHLHGSNIDP